MLCRAKQARKRGGYAAAVLALVAFRIRVYAPWMCANRARTRGTYVWTGGGEGEKMGEAKVAGMMRNIYHDWRAHHPLPRGRSRPDRVPTRPWRRRDTLGRVSSVRKNHARFSKTAVSRTKHYLTTQNRSTGCAPNGEHAAVLVVRPSDARLHRTVACLRSVSCTRQPDLWIFVEIDHHPKESQTTRWPRRATLVGRGWQRTGWFGWLANMGSKRSGGAYGAFGDAGCKGWRAGVANPTYFFNAPKQGRTASVSGVPPTTPPGTSTVS